MTRSGRHVVLLSLLVAAGWAGAGCGHPEYSGFLEPYDGFQKIGKLNPNLEYVRPGVDWEGYQKVRIAQVLTNVEPKEGYRAVNPDELKRLTDAFETELKEAFAENYAITTEPGPGVLDVRAAITRLRPTNRAANVASWVLPGSLAITTGFQAATNSNLALGEAGTEVAFVDSETGGRLYGFVGLHLGSGIELQQVTRWGIAENALKKWASYLAERLLTLRSSGESGPPASEAGDVRPP